MTVLVASDISDARLEWPLGRDKGTAAGEITTGAAGVNRCDSGSRVPMVEDSIVGGRDDDAGGLEDDEEEEGCRWWRVLCCRWTIIGAC